MKSLLIYASELAACLNRNKYKSVNECTRLIWTRYDSESYNSALMRNELEPEESVEKILESSGVKESIQLLIRENDQKNSLKLEDEIKKVFQDSNDSNVELDKKLMNQVKSFIHTSKGTRDEEKSLDLVQEETGIAIEQRNSKFYKKKINEKVSVGGRVDGIQSDGTLVEMKNRQYRFFNVVPIYEKIQVHVYMFLTDRQECKLIESFRGKTKTTMITFDQNLWDSIKIEIEAFAESFHNLQEDPKLQDHLLSNPNNDFSNYVQEVVSEVECDGCKFNWCSQKDHACLGYGL
jgi:hypothetical protein